MPKGNGNFKWFCMRIHIISGCFISGPKNEDHAEEFREDSWTKTTGLLLWFPWAALRALRWTLTGPPLAMALLPLSADHRQFWHFRPFPVRPAAAYFLEKSHVTTKPCLRRKIVFLPRFFGLCTTWPSKGGGRFHLKYKGQYCTTLKWTSSKAKTH